MNKRIERFREELEQSYQGLSEVDHLGAAVLAHLCSFFDNLFPRGKQPVPENVPSLIEKYCYKEKNRCPICGSLTVGRRGKYGAFYGCARYPACRGTRRTNGSIPISSALIEFLNEAQKTEQTPQSTDRFDTIEV